MFLFGEAERSPVGIGKTTLYGPSDNIPVDNTARREPEDFLTPIKPKG
jgi:hypothetical protein